LLRQEVFKLRFEVGVVDAHPPLILDLLVDEDRVGKPLRMEDFSDEAVCE
jgi:hypothetical protein